MLKLASSLNKTYGIQATEIDASLVSMTSFKMNLKQVNKFSALSGKLSLLYRSDKASIRRHIAVLTLTSLPTANESMGY